MISEDTGGLLVSVIAATLFKTLARARMSDQCPLLTSALAGKESAKRMKQEQNGKLFSADPILFSV